MCGIKRTFKVFHVRIWGSRIAQACVWALLANHLSPFFVGLISAHPSHNVRLRNHVTTGCHCFPVSCLLPSLSLFFVFINTLPCHCCHQCQQKNVANNSCEELPSKQVRNSVECSSLFICSAFSTPEYLH